MQLVLRSKIAWTQQQLKGGYGPSYGTMAAASEADPAAGQWAAGRMAGEGASTSRKTGTRGGYTREAVTHAWRLRSSTSRKTGTQPYKTAGR